MWTFSLVSANGGLSLVVVLGILTAVAPRVVGRRLQGLWASGVKLLGVKRTGSIVNSNVKLVLNGVQAYLMELVLRSLSHCI